MGRRNLREHRLRSDTIEAVVDGNFLDRYPARIHRRKKQFAGFGQRSFFEITFAGHELATVLEFGSSLVFENSDARP